MHDYYIELGYINITSRKITNLVYSSIVQTLYLWYVGSILFFLEKHARNSIVYDVLYYWSI